MTTLWRIERHRSGWFTVQPAALGLWIAAWLIPVPAFAQKPEYEFIGISSPTSFFPKVQDENKWALTNAEVLERYAEKLRREGGSDAEIARRFRHFDPHSARGPRCGLLQPLLPRRELQLQSCSKSVPEGGGKRSAPGTALDYGMGEGRNSIYLARLGWEVWGFDPADAGVALAQQRAKQLGLTLQTQAVSDRDYDFGREKFDLILFSWTMPLGPLQRIVDALKPGGIVVMECGREFYGGGNEMLHKFDALEIIRFAMVRAKSDWGDRRVADVFQLVARKP